MSSERLQRAACAHADEWHGRLFRLDEEPQEAGADPAERPMNLSVERESYADGQQRKDITMEQQTSGSKRGVAPQTGTIAAKSQQAADKLKETVVDQANQVRDKALFAREQTSDRIRDVATQLKNVSETLRPNDPLAANLAERASTSIDGVARYVRSSDAQSIVRDAEQLARREPALFFGGAFLLGLVAGRFLKSSAPRERYSSDGYGNDLEPGRSRSARESGFFTPTSSAGETRSYPSGSGKLL